MRVVLPSNNSMEKYFPENSLSTFTVRLPYPLDFSVGKWECVLTEIQFLKSWFNVTGGVVTLTVGIDPTEITIPDSYYSSPSKLIDAINQRITEAWSKSHNEQYNFKLVYMEFTKKFRVTSKRGRPGLTFAFNDSLSKVLGCKDMEIVRGEPRRANFQGLEKDSIDLLIRSNDIF